MKSFEEYLKEGIILRITPDLEIAEDLIKESENKKSFLKILVEKIEIQNNNANNYLEQCYDIIMLLIRAKLYSKGYKSQGVGAHQAEISYLKNLGFLESEIIFLDELRYYRNRIKYYGKRLTRNYAIKTLKFLDGIYTKLLDS